MSVQDRPAAATFAWEVMALDVLVQTSNRLGSWFSLSTSVCLFSCSYLFIHLFLDLIEASTLGRFLVLRFCSQKKNSAGPGSHW